MHPNKNEITCLKTKPVPERGGERRQLFCNCSVTIHIDKTARARRKELGSFNAVRLDEL